MALSSTIQSTLLRHQRDIDYALRSTLNKVATASQIPALETFYGQMQYHLGWVDTNLAPITSNPGKLLRPTLLLLAYEAVGAWKLINTSTSTTSYLQRALPAAVAVELTHNFTLIHDDIEDGDTERRHRSTLWKVWGVPQAINTGDGMYALSRIALWNLLEQGVDSSLVARLGTILDQTILIIAEGQYLDISFESRQDISVSMYLDMITRKTAALLCCAAEMGACLGTKNEEIIQSLRSFGHAIGIAFQIRDDILGVWASNAELGKTAAGDIFHRKKSLPILHALEHATPDDQHVLRDVYAQETTLDTQQVALVLDIFARTQTQEYCRQFLAQHCQQAQEALTAIPIQADPISRRALDDMATVLQFVANATH